MRSLGIVGFLTAVVGMECATVWFLLSRAQTTWAGSSEATTTKGEKPTEFVVSPHPVDGTANTIVEVAAPNGVEVDLGEYTITTLRLSTNTTLRVDFHLFGLIEPAQVDHFSKVWPTLTNRFREVVITTVRAAQPSDLADPALALIKRQIMEKSNRLFGRPIFHALIVSNFSLVEQ